MFVIKKILSVEKLRIPAFKASFSWLIILLSFCLCQSYAQPSVKITVTVSMASTNSGPVDLGLAADFMILAGSTIIAGGGGAINGDVGLSPSAGSLMGVTDAQVNGTIYVVDDSGPLGSVVNTGLLTEAKNDLNTAYNDVASRIPVPAGSFLNPGSPIAGNIGGLNLVPGLYKFTGQALIQDADLTLTGGPDDIWIFQIASELIVEAGVNRSVILAGGAKANNVLWQVGTSATLGTGSVFKGTIMADQSITIDTGSTIDGRALARTGAVIFNGTSGSVPQDIFELLSIQINVPTNVATYTSMTNLQNFSGTSSDNIGVTLVTLRNSRDVAGFNCTGTDNWLFNNMQLFQGENFLDAIAFDAFGNSVTGVVNITYSGDAQYDDVLRSGNVIQEIIFPDGANLIPGTTVPVQWKVLSYAPIVCRVYAGIPGGWSFFQNGAYQGVTNSAWNLNGRFAKVYSFDCAWPVPQKPGDFKVWFNVAQMDGDQFMIPVIPDGVDDRIDPTYAKLIQRTIISTNGIGVDPMSGLDNWDSTRIFETVAQHKERSAVTITDINLTDNLVVGEQVTCQWKVQSYIDVNAQLLLLNVATSNTWLQVNATRIGVPVDTTYYFQDRATGLRYYAREYTFQATFTVPNQPGLQQVYFRSKDSANPASSWMAENLAALVDPQPVLQNGMYGRMIERTIVNP